MNIVVTTLLTTVPVATIGLGGKVIADSIGGGDLADMFIDTQEFITAQGRNAAGLVVHDPQTVTDLQARAVSVSATALGTAGVTTLIKNTTDNKTNEKDLGNKQSDTLNIAAENIDSMDFPSP